jgi:hypothetical protein
VGGVDACQGSSLAASMGRPVKESQGQNWTGENSPSGIVGGLQERGQHGSRTEARRETAGVATVTLNCQAHSTSIPTLTGDTC